LLEPGNLINQIQIDGNAATGVSGAPVTDMNDRRVGMLARNALGCDTIAFIIPAPVSICEYLWKHEPPLRILLSRSVVHHTTCMYVPPLTLFAII